MCLSNSCVENFRFFSATGFTGKLTPIDGIMGLAPDNPENPTSFTTALYNAGLIDKRVFGFIFGKGDFKSQIMFGDYDISRRLNPSEPIYWFNLLNTKRWEIEV